MRSWTNSKLVDLKQVTNQRPRISFPLIPSLFDSWKALAKKQFRATQVFLKRVQPKLPNQNQIESLHESVFQNMDCLTCVNCCKTAKPVFTRTDVERISAFKNLKASQLEIKFLMADADGDWVPTTVPCPFLNPDNRCSVYEVRPKSCRSTQNNKRFQE